MEVLWAQHLHWQYDSHKSRAASTHPHLAGVCSAHPLGVVSWPLCQLAGLGDVLFRLSLESSFSARVFTLSGCQG